jgi:hypothetical protein
MVVLNNKDLESKSMVRMFIILDGEKGNCLCVRKWEIDWLVTMVQK